VSKDSIYVSEVDLVEKKPIVAKNREEAPRHRRQAPGGAGEENSTIGRDCNSSEAKRKCGDVVLCQEVPDKEKLDGWSWGTGRDQKSTSRQNLHIMRKAPLRLRDSTDDTDEKDKRRLPARGK